jgi:hypothetical protein
MALPFLQEEKRSTPSIKGVRSPDSPTDDGLLSAAQDLLKAIENKDIKSLCDALDAFFEIRDAMPHYEGENLGEEE